MKFDELFVSAPAPSAFGAKPAAGGGLFGSAPAGEIEKHVF